MPLVAEDFLQPFESLQVCGASPYEGGFRLPDETHRGAAGTSVQSDDVDLVFGASAPIVDHR